MAAHYEIVEHVRPRLEPKAGNRYSIRPLVGLRSPEEPMNRQHGDAVALSEPPVEPAGVPLEEAAAYYSERLGSYPQDLWALNNMALVALRRQEPETALGHLQQALDAHRQITDAVYATLVLALMKSNKPELVERIASSAVQVRQMLQAMTTELGEDAAKAGTPEG